MSVYTTDEIAVDLLARYDKLERQLQNADRVVDRRLGNMEGRAQAFAGRFTGLLAGISAAALVGELAKMSDTAKQLDAQLKLATSGFGSYGQAQEDVRRLTAETRGELTATASLYGNFVRASQEAGRSQSDAARATETFAKALKIGGAGANEAASATLQFGQALASGVLRGDEFNSIMEASPRIARLLADSLGVPIGQLRKMAEAGELTRDRLFRALTQEKFTSGIDAEFKTLPTTFGDAMTQIENAAVLTFGAFDKGGQFSNALTNMLTEGTASFSGLEQAAQKYGETNRTVIDGIVGTFNTLKGEATATANATGNQFTALGDTLSTVFNPLGVNATTVFSGVRREADYTVQTIANILSGIDQLRNFLPDLQRRAQQFDESTFGRRLGFTGDLGPRSELSGQFRQQVARGRIANATARNAEPAAITSRATRAVASTVSPTGGSKAGASGAGKTEAQRQAEKAATDFMQLIAQVNADLREGLANTSNTFTTESERLARSSRNFQGIFGREGEDYADPFAGVKDYDADRDARFEAAEDAEREAQSLRRDNIQDLADLYGDLFTRGSGQVWANFKDQGLRTIALLLAQFTANNFKLGGSSGGGLSSLLGLFSKGATLAGGITGPSSLGNSSLGYSQIDLPNFGGGRAVGGPVSSGTTYLVGERGPELLTMGNQAGLITPNGQLASMMAGASIAATRPSAAAAPQQVNITVTLSDDLNGRVDSRSAGMIVEVLRQATPGIIQAATVNTVAEIRKPGL